MRARLAMPVPPFTRPLGPRAPLPRRHSQHTSRALLRLPRSSPRGPRRCRRQQSQAASHFRWPAPAAEWSPSLRVRPRGWRS
eukprot:2677333-Rhodomonas_salina.4